MGKESNKKDIRTWIDFLAPAGILLVLFIFCTLANYPLMIPVVLVLIGLHLYFVRKASLRMYLNLGLLLTLVVFTAHMLKTYTTLPYYYIPVAGISMLTVLLFKDLWLSFVMAFSSSLLVSLILKGDFGMMVTFFVGSLVAAYSIEDARTRGKVMVAGIFVSVANLVCLTLIFPDYKFFFNRDFTMAHLYPLAANGLICSFFVVGTLKVFEYMFDAVSNFTLLELSDFNQPLLKRMVMEAPGTYHHSLVVSNLAETAANAIGADALLTRVGAYYHDIGKMTKPEYFTENQMMGANKHDNIEPSMSRLVLLNHVKEGIDLAKKYKLNQVIIDFIPQHHGTSLMHFFYQRAVESAEQGGAIDENDYRYPGPKPQTRETAITLMADSVEGATRALDDPTPQNVEETVKKVINNKFIDGQLDECPLTLKEIEKISQTFIRILSAMYHTRVKYPEKKNGSPSRKLSKENTPQSSQDPSDRKNNHSS